MQLNLFAIILATILQFIVGALWYSLLFGKLWGRIHGFDKLPKEAQDKMAKEMAPFYGIQFIVTLVTTIILSLMLPLLRPVWDPFMIAILLWLGFVLPVQTSAVIFGGTENKWILKKIAVQSSASLLFLLIATITLSYI